jgi:hypothetical protein
VSGNPARHAGARNRSAVASDLCSQPGVKTTTRAWPGPRTGLPCQTIRRDDVSDENQVCYHTGVQFSNVRTPVSSRTRTPARTGRVSSGAAAKTTCSIAVLSTAPSISMRIVPSTVAGVGKSSAGNVAMLASYRSQARCSLWPLDVRFSETCLPRSAPRSRRASERALWCGLPR